MIFLALEISGETNISQNCNTVMERIAPIDFNVFGTFHFSVHSSRMQFLQPSKSEIHYYSLKKLIEKS